MKKLAILFLAVGMFAGVACSDEPSKDGEEQVSQPVLNSGAETEADRATEAAKDTATDGNRADSTVRND